MAAIASVTPSPDAFINALLSNYKWASGSLTYSFPSSYTYYESGYGSNEPLRNFEGLNATQQGAVRAAFANFAAVANVTFAELTGSSAANATLRLAMSDAPSTAWAYMPHTGAEGGDSWYNNASGVYDNPHKGNYAYTTFLHEIGHALGLEHPHENGMPASGDSMEFTVMSYRAYEGAPLTGYPNESEGFAQSLMMYDIAAVQHLYGANFSSNSGNTTYSWSPTTGQAFINGVGQTTPGANRIFQTVWDGGGSDTYDFSNYTTNLNVDLRPGEWTTVSSAQLARLHYNGSQIADGNIANALQHNGDLRSLIENAIGGSGNDTIIGNSAANTLWGGLGSDQIFGGEGDDIVFGGSGDDQVDGGSGTDIAVWQGLVAEYTLSRDASGVISVRDNVGGRDGLDAVVGVERFQFSDRSLSVEELFGSSLVLSEFGINAGGWSSNDLVPRHLADVNGDGVADIIGFASGGVIVALSNGTGSFSSGSFVLGEFGINAGGWSSDDLVPRHLADINGDGRADIVGFASGGVLVALANGAGSFSSGNFVLGEFGINTGGWSSDDIVPRHLADVNGDGRADIVGFASGGVLVALANGAGSFSSGNLVLGEFGINAGGWSSDDLFPRRLADVNGDGMADIVGFASAGVYVALATGSGLFAPGQFVLPEFGTNSGWTSNDAFPRMLADVNGDGMADIVGFASTGILVALADGAGSFSNGQLVQSEFGTSAGGWSGNDHHPRLLADIDGDGEADLLGFHDAGVFVAGADFIV